MIFMATRAIFNSLESLKSGGSGTDLSDELVVEMGWGELAKQLKFVSRWSEWANIDRMYT